MHNRKKNSNKEIGLIAYMAVFFIEKYEQDELEKLKKIHLVLDTAIHCCDSHDADMDNQGVLDRLQTAKQSYPSPDFAARHQKKSFYRTILDFFLGLFEKIIQYFSSSPHRAKTNDVTSTAPEEKKIESIHHKLGGEHSLEAITLDDSFMPVQSQTNSRSFFVDAMNATTTDTVNHSIVRQAQPL